MRVMLKAQIPVAKGNEMIRSGSMKGFMERVVKELEPEAAYFYTEDGLRTPTFIFDLKESSDSVKMAEAFFGELEANVHLTPVMTWDDLQRGLGQL